MLVCCDVFEVVCEFCILWSWQDGYLDIERRWVERRSVYRRSTMRGFCRIGRNVECSCSRYEYDRNLAVLTLYQFTAFMWFFHLYFGVEDRSDVKDCFTIFIFYQIYEEKREWCFCVALQNVHYLQYREI